MSASPDLKNFAPVYEMGRPQAVWTTFVADLETPVSTMLKLAEGRANSFLLESVEGGAVRGRYSVIGLKPDLIWRCFEAKAEINTSARYAPDAFAPCAQSPLVSMRKLIRDSHIDLPKNLPPMAAGLIGYVGYDMVRHMERLPEPNPDALHLPDAILMRPTIMAIFDSVEDLVTLVTPVWPEEGLNARAAYGRAAERLADTVADLERPLPVRFESAETDIPEPTPISNTSEAECHRYVERRAV